MSQKFIGTNFDRPGREQIEINIFGPGYGESCLLHIGNGKWVVIDSCIDSESGSPAALNYLNQIGEDPSIAVEMIIATHWHDDHIRGISSLLGECKSAKFCASSALSNAEFLSTIAAYNQNNTIASGSGAREILTCLNILQNRKYGITPSRALADKRLYFLDSKDTSHGVPVEIWSLSPSDAQFEEFLKSLGSLMPNIGETKRRAIAGRPNNLSVVIWVSFGPTCLLFGADLENLRGEDLGWNAIVRSQTRPGGRGCFFKIPHHGSINAHHADTWATLLTDAPIAVLTPWNLGKPLPSVSDIDRIISFGAKSYSTSDLRPKTRPRRSNLVEKQIRESTVSFRNAEVRTGHIRIRSRGYLTEQIFDCDLFGSACTLQVLKDVLLERV